MTARRLTALATTALSAGLAAALLAPGPAPAQAETNDAESGSTLSADTRGLAAAPARTRLTFKVPDCEGCKIRLTQARRTLDADVVHVWESRERKVRDGKVTFRPATRRTWGMSALVRAPWEGHTGYAATVAWRYNGKQVGETVTLAEAVDKRRAAACWEGTRRRKLTIPLVVEEVEVDGVHERVPGTLVFAPTTQSWLAPMREVWDGVLGSQDVNICR